MTMGVDKQAPVVAESEIVIAADPDRVWDVLTDFESWPKWNPAVKSMSIQGGVEPGTDFNWKAGPGTIKSQIQQVERPRLIGWTGKTLGIAAVHAYRLEAEGGQTSVRTEESYDGFIARVFRVRMQKMLEGSLAAGLQHLKAEAERRSPS